MIFFSVWCYSYSREVLRELFRLPKPLIATGILGILEDLDNPTRRGWAFWLDLFQHTSQHKEPSQKTPAANLPSWAGLWALTSANTRANPKSQSPKLQPQKSLPQGWASGLDLCQHAKPTQRAKPRSPAIQPTKYQYNSNITPI